MNVKKILFSLLPTVGLLCVTAHAQWNQSAKDQTFYTNNPCANPKISWALWNESAGFNKPHGGLDCNPGNYSTWNTAMELEANLRSYRNQLSRQGVSLGILVVASNGHTTQVVSFNGAPAFDMDYGVVSHDGGSIVAAGGGNVVSHDGGSIVAAGGGNFYGVKAVGDRVVQFPGRWVKVSQPAAAPQPATPSPASGTYAGPPHDDAIQICLNNAVNQVRRADNGANHISVTVGGGTANFQGNVLSASYKGQLERAATGCGARATNSNNLRVGR